MGGKDKYDNLVWLNTDVHKLIHAKKEDTIKTYLDKLGLNKEAKNKVNKLRRLAGNLNI